ncbi:ABC transporter permease subunit [Salipiger sp. IMCC34102]|uniref:ABC transporter permease n=1 Tax=Salipiger sp. IMCC34102 TaxID=2510647 RepID=UPI00101C159C|nr:ABC transporter permease subunit [Salipiger sp. IMCC34102]RYH04457.1 ABC transporter permease subunit [Salipiger sp. IMCC34102]
MAGPSLDRPAAAGAAGPARDRFRRSAQGGGIEWLSLPLFLALWGGLSLALDHRLFPTPLGVAIEIREQITQGRMLADFAITLTRVTAAFATAMILGAVIGAALGRWRTADRLFNPWIVVGLNIPAIVVAIICYIWIGLTDIALIVAVVVNKTPLVATTLREGVRALSADYDELARVYRMSPWRRLRLVVVPQLMSYVLTAARTGLSLIWKIVLVFEVLGSDGGVGFRIGIFFSFFDMSAILAYTTGFVAVILAVEYGVLRPLEKRILGWRPVPL